MDTVLNDRKQQKSPARSVDTLQPATAVVIYYKAERRTNMRKVPFTEEQIRQIEQNKYTYSVSKKGNIVYTLEFKQYFVDQVRRYGKTTREIFSEAGYDTEAIGLANLSNTRIRIMREANSPEGFKAPRGLSSEERIRVFEQKKLSEQKTEASIRELQERIVHLEKQVEFLKKISRMV